MSKQLVIFFLICINLGCNMLKKKVVYPIDASSWMFVESSQNIILADSQFVHLFIDNGQIRIFSTLSLDTLYGSYLLKKDSVFDYIHLPVFLVEPSRWYYKKYSYKIRKKDHNYRRLNDDLIEKLKQKTSIEQISEMEEWAIILGISHAMTFQIDSNILILTGKDYGENTLKLKFLAL